MFVLGYCMAHVMIPAQAASMAQIDRANTGRASTLFNAVRQIGSATGVAVLSTVIAAVGFGTATATSGHGSGTLQPYHVAFAVAAGFAFVGALLALTINDSDAEATRVPRRGRSEAPKSTPASVPA
jgi:hypothetical protein